MSKGEISIDMIVIILVAIVSITLLIGLFGTKLPGLGKEIYCRTFFQITSITFLGGTRVDQSYCVSKPSMPVVQLTRHPFEVHNFADGSESQTIDGEGSVSLDAESITIDSAALTFSIANDTPVPVAVAVGSGRVGFRFTVNSSERPYTLNFTAELARALNASKRSEVALHIAASRVRVHELSIRSERYFVVDELMAAALKCWRGAEYGRVTKDILCYEVVVPAGYNEQAGLVSERNVTAYMVQEGICDVLPNNDADPACGNVDSLDWKAGNISARTNFIVEYVAKTKKIRVS